MNRRRRRGGFATIEIFVVSPVFLAIGLAATFSVRWLFQTSHWSTWAPTVLLGIPFLIVYGVIVPMIAYAILKERLGNSD